MAACDDSAPMLGCGPGALCAQKPGLVVTGVVTASLNPIPGVEVTAAAYRDSCGGILASYVPASAIDTTDANGRYAIGIYPADSVAGACIRVSYSTALFADRTGIQLVSNPVVPESLRVDLVGP
ncbi:MAG: hypothetical protein ABI765_12260 [Gemmatimonadota bacterium]